MEKYEEIQRENGKLLRQFEEYLVQKLFIAASMPLGYAYRNHRKTICWEEYVLQSSNIGRR
jgi:hypothetical protein